MSTQERLERMKTLKEGIIRNSSLFSKLSDSEIERTEREVEAVTQQIFQDEVRLTEERQGIETEATQAYCPSLRRTCNREYCENLQQGKPCASFERCYN